MPVDAAAAVPGSRNRSQDEGSLARSFGAGSHRRHRSATDAVAATGA